MTGDAGDDPTRDRDSGPEQVESAFEHSVDEGRRRLTRSWPALLATGMIGGLDVGIGVLALLVVREQTGSPLLAALAFSIGFIALSLANSELFTENFLVPIAAVAARRAPARSIIRLWVGTGAMNLAGGWLVMALVMAGIPNLRETAVIEGQVYIDLSVGTEAFARAVLAGMAITLMTWMEHSTDSDAGRLAAVVSIAFLLTATPLNHAIVASQQMFAALQAGAPFGYVDWVGSLGVAVVGNVAGGVGLVTILRLVQVGRPKIEQERARADES